MMPLRPIDAIFIHPEKRFYVVYFRGELWQLPRMKLDAAAWQRRQPYHGDTKALYLSQHQTITDPLLAQKLRTLSLPVAIHGSSLPRFEAWWEAQGFTWLKNLLNEGKSPLAVHRSSIKTETVASDINLTNNTSKNTATSVEQIENPISSHTETEDDIFADMLATLTDEVLQQRY